MTDGETMVSLCSIPHVIYRALCLHVRSQMIDSLLNSFVKIDSESSELLVAKLQIFSCIN